MSDQTNNPYAGYGQSSTQSSSTRPKSKWNPNDSLLRIRAELGMSIPMNFDTGRSLQPPVRNDNQFLRQGGPSTASNIYQPDQQQRAFPSLKVAAQPSQKLAGFSTTAGVAQENQASDNRPPTPMSADEWKDLKSLNRAANIDPSNGYVCMECGDGFKDFWSLVIHENNSHPPLEKPQYPKPPEGHKCVKCKNTFHCNSALETHEETCFLPPFKYPDDWNEFRKSHKGFIRYIECDPNLSCPVTTCKYFGVSYMNTNGNSSSLLLHMVKFHGRDIEELDKM